MTISHYERCFGCGPANAHGLNVELEQAPGGGVAGRFAIEERHQGPPGFAHGGVIASLLDEAMSLAIHAEGIYAWTSRLEIELKAPAPVGSTLVISARIAERSNGTLTVVARAETVADGRLLAAGTGSFVERS